MSKSITGGEWRVEGPTNAANPNLGLWEVEGDTNVCTHCTLADAHHIAASKDMREALEALLSDLSSSYEPSAETVAKAEAALLKARGESPSSATEEGGEG